MRAPLIIAVLVTFAGLSYAQSGLPADIVPITDDPRCAGRLTGINDPEAALRTGCARLAVGHEDARYYRLLSAWRGAQVGNRGHYAPRAIGGNPNATPVVAMSTAAPIREKCAKDWPDDFAMRATCERVQNEAVVKLSGRSMTTADQQTIRKKCAGDWPDDASMRNTCEEVQLKALSALGR